jgi:hypothetical protein
MELLMVERDYFYIHLPIRHPLVSPANVYPEERRPNRSHQGESFAAAGVLTLREGS